MYRCAVFAAAISALALMTVLSAMMGQTLPALLDPTLTHYAATALFFFFGVKLLKDAAGMEAGGDLKEELEEVEEELQAKEMEELNGSGGGLLPSGATSPAARSRFRATGARVMATGSKLLRRFFSKVFLTCFSMTFLAEWGDRSQIATIALAAQQDWLGVTAGGIVGHSICTGVAVLGGKLLATRISERTILIMGGILFLIFGVHSVYYFE
jgi:putative Ca2+/H+ antiporter (TMEM165/GDT1 family)